MHLIRLPLVKRDLLELVDHIIETTQCVFAAAFRGLDEIDAQLEDIAANPHSKERPGAPADGWLVLHEGRGHRITIVFRADAEQNAMYVALVAFGGRHGKASERRRNQLLLILKSMKRTEGPTTCFRQPRRKG